MANYTHFFGVYLESKTDLSERQRPQNIMDLSDKKLALLSNNILELYMDIIIMKWNMHK